MSCSSLLSIATAEPPRRALHLDSEYRRRWEEYHLANGDVRDSRQVNWRFVDWPEVVKLVAIVENQRYELTSALKPDFKGFMRFRWTGKEPTYDGATGRYTGHKRLDVWSIGWTDGCSIQMIDIDFYTGRRLGDWTAPLDRYMRHLHPLLARRLLNGE